MVLERNSSPVVSEKPASFIRQPQHVSNSRETAGGVLLEFTAASSAEGVLQTSPWS